MEGENHISERDDVVIRFSGDSGDGMQMTGKLFTDTAALMGNGISTFPDFPAEIRAPQGTVSGVSGFQVHIGDHPVSTPGDYCDVLVAMNPAALRANARWLKPGATIICDGDTFNDRSVERAGFRAFDPVTEMNLQDYNVVFPHMTSMTREAVATVGLDPKAASKCKNMFALGICFCIYNRPLDHAVDFIRRKFAKKPAVAEANVLALKGGYNYASNTHAFANTYVVRPAPLPAGLYRSISGNQATAWGLMAASEKSGRPLFCGSYPITPATAILEELAKRKDLNVKTLQAEDEISGICTAIGAAYAGNFAVTTTSGPGLSLKSEAIGLAVMTELPLVIVDVQRGGPSTGLPTKPEQADLNQALWGRNGECPLVVMAASTPSNCFHYAFWAGKIAMEHMTPVLLLSDGFIANGSEPWRIPSMKEYPKITPPIVTRAPEGGFQPYARDEKRLARMWALPGTKGVEHRVGKGFAERGRVARSGESRAHGRPACGQGGPRAGFHPQARGRGRAPGRAAGRRVGRHVRPSADGRARATAPGRAGIALPLQLHSSAAPGRARDFLAFPADRRLRAELGAVRRLSAAAVSGIRVPSVQ